MRLFLTLSQPVEWLIVAGGTAGALTAIIALAMRVIPVFKIHGRIGKNELRIATLESSLAEMQKENRAADRLIVRGIIAMSDSFITGNGVEPLKTVRSDMLNYLEKH